MSFSSHYLSPCPPINSAPWHILNDTLSLDTEIYSYDKIVSCSCLPPGQRFLVPSRGQIFTSELWYCLYYNLSTNNGNWDNKPFISVKSKVSLHEMKQV